MNPKLSDIEVSIRFDPEAVCAICGVMVEAPNILDASDLEDWLDDIRTHLRKHA